MSSTKSLSPIELSATAFWHMAHVQSGDRLLRQKSDVAEEAFWRDYAKGYDEKSPLAECAGALIRDLRALVHARWRLLEIGAGTGAFTRRLAPAIGCITVVEPSAAMRAEFGGLWDKAKDVEMLPCKWEDAPDFPADIVFGANAFYRISDIAAAVLKMDRLAMHRVALVQTVGRPHANPLCVSIDGVEHERERADVLCDVLTEIGIVHRRRDYDVPRPDGPSRVALIDWVPSSKPSQP